MNFELFGLEQDLKIEGENIEKYYSDYLELNKILGIDENRYDNLLLEYGTEELKYSLSLMTNTLRNIEKKGYRIIDPIFDTFRSSGDYELGIFIANRIIEKYKETNSETPESFLIRIYALKNALDFLSLKDDKLYYLKYLRDFIKELSEFLDIYPSYIEEIYKLGVHFYSFLYIHYLTIENETEKALGFLLKLYNLRKSMFEKDILKYSYEHNIYYLINIILLYFKVNDELVKLSVDINEYISDLKVELEKIKEFIDKSPKYQIVLSSDLKRYINEVLTTLYSVGFEDDYNEIVSIFPNILSKEHRLIIKLYEIDRMDTFEALDKLKKIKSDIDTTFNNFTNDKKEIISFLFYNTYVNHLGEDLEEIEKIKLEIEKLSKKFSSLKVVLAKTLVKIGQREEAKSLLEKEKEKAIISGNKALQKLIEDYLSSEF